MTRQSINPKESSQPTGYSHVVIAQGSRLVFIAGQTAANVDGQVVGIGDLTAQTQQVFDNVAACLAAAGASFADVTRLTTYVVNFQPEMRPAINEIRQRLFPIDPPVSTLLGVQALARPEFLIEVEATAVLP